VTDTQWHNGHGVDLEEKKYSPCSHASLYMF
jgi:hypothetical protein